MALYKPCISIRPPCGPQPRTTPGHQHMEHLVTPPLSPHPLVPAATSRAHLVATIWAHCFSPEPHTGTPPTGYPSQRLPWPQHQHPCQLLAPHIPPTTVMLAWHHPDIAPTVDTPQWEDTLQMAPARHPRPHTAVAPLELLRQRVNWKTLSAWWMD